jgi:hypothetical protein
MEGCKRGTPLKQEFHLQQAFFYLGIGGGRKVRMIPQYLVFNTTLFKI